MYFIQRREWSPKAERFGLIYPFKTKFRGRHLPKTIDDVLHDRQQLQKAIAEEFGDGYYMIRNIGGRGRLEVVFTGNCSTFY